METQKVQHELSPKMEVKIAATFKKLIKVYAVVFIGFLGLMIALFISYYLFVMRPAYQRGLEMQKRFEEQSRVNQERFERERQANEDSFKQYQIQQQQQFDQDLQNAQTQFNIQKDATLK